MARAWSAEYRTTTLCIDSYENGVPKGRFYNPFMKGGKSFESLTQLLIRIPYAQVTSGIDRHGSTLGGIFGHFMIFVQVLHGIGIGFHEATETELIPEDIL